MVWVNHFSAFTIYSWLTEKFLKVWKTANHYGIILKEVISRVDDCSSKWEKMPRNRGRQRKYPQEQGREILLINMELSPSLTMTWRGCPQSRQQFSTSSDCHFFFFWARIWEMVLVPELLDFPWKILFNLNRNKAHIFLRYAKGHTEDLTNLPLYV